MRPALMLAVLTLLKDLLWRTMMGSHLEEDGAVEAGLVACACSVLLAAVEVDVQA
jgi:hypothetical protein